MTSAAFRENLSPFYRLIALDQVASTNDEALARAAEGAEEGTLLTARRQTAGRGRRGRAWHSQAGNLFLSLILKPEPGPQGPCAVGFAAALAVCDAVGRLMAQSARKSEAEIALKWPNDVLINGRKVSGLLIERTGDAADSALVLGVGVNLVSHPGDTRYPATDLQAEGIGEISVSEALGAFCAAFLRRYRGWQQDGFGPLREAWLARAKGIGENLTVDIEGRRFDGVFRTIDEDGALCLDLGDAGMKKVTAGDVYFHDSPGEAAC